ncbi:GtrA family protein [Streptococcus mitis]|uniref:GtrA family protein n=1 Tax=Streptococcus mitis TaxID=28037 RepID=UPI0021BD2310|nr:GtrA family protein [Streptococcus mitis]
MKKRIQSLVKNELLLYLFFGIATTLVSILSRLVIYQLTNRELLATGFANIIGILFAFITNDTIVFKQARKNWSIRLMKFTLARLSTFLLDLILTFLFVTQFPNIIGQFVNNNIDKVNSIETVISQFLIIILNYIFSKVFIFKKIRKNLSI